MNGLSNENERPWEWCFHEAGHAVAHLADPMGWVYCVRVLTRQQAYDGETFEDRKGRHVTDVGGYVEGSSHPWSMVVGQACEACRSDFAAYGDEVTFWPTVSITRWQLAIYEANRHMIETTMTDREAGKLNRRSALRLHMNAAVYCAAGPMAEAMHSGCQEACDCEDPGSFLEWLPSVSKGDADSLAYFSACWRKTPLGRRRLLERVHAETLAFLRLPAAWGAVGRLASALRERGVLYGDEAIAIAGDVPALPHPYKG